MSEKIQVFVRQVYGRQVIYPSCAKALLFATLIGARSLEHRHLQAIEALGYQIEQIPDPKGVLAREAA